jgi:formiminotetrahydrofolate cyclodeaminase
MEEVAMFTTQTIQEFLDSLASDAPTPGGGSVAAISGAMGSALVSMVCKLTIGKKKYTDVEADAKEILEKSESLRSRLTQMVTDDAASFDRVISAYRMPRQSEQEIAARDQAIQTALMEATLVPLAAAQACAEIITLCQPSVRIGNVNAISDLGVAVMMAFAGVKSAALNVWINLGNITDVTFVKEKKIALDLILKKYSVLADEVYEAVKSKLCVQS